MRTPSTLELLHQAELESIVLLENKNDILPLSTSINSLAVIGPLADVVNVSTQWK